MATSIRSIAQAIGVSRSTVMRALRNENNVRPELAEKIRDYAREHHYETNLLAKGVLTGKTRMIAVIAPAVNAPLCAEDIQGVIDGLTQHDYLAFVMLTNGNQSMEYKAIRRSAQSRVDGIVLLPTQNTADAGHFDEIGKRGIPLVLLSRPMFETPYDIFTGSDETDGYRLAQHLLKLGHTRISFIPASNAEREGMVWRQNGWERAMREAGLDTEGSIVELEALDEVLSKPKRPTAVFANHESMLPKVYDAVYRAGLRFVEDISVATFLVGGEIRLKRWLPPRPGGMPHNGVKMGFQAAERLIERIENGDVEGTRDVVMVPGGDIINGDTIGPVPV